LGKIVRRHEKQLAENAKKKGKRNATDRQTKELKTALEALHAEVKTAESYYNHIKWLEERFPKAEIETRVTLKKAISAGRALAELKGLAELFQIKPFW